MLLSHKSSDVGFSVFWGKKVCVKDGSSGAYSAASGGEKE